MIQKFVKRYLNSMQKKMIFMVTVILSILFLTAYISIDRIVKTEQYDTLSEKYSYLNDRIVSSFQHVKQELDTLTGEFILNDYVQKSLTNQKLTLSDLGMLDKSLAFHNRSYLDYYLVIDNKGNLYSQKLLNLDLEEFKTSLFYEILGDDYSRTKILWAEDTVFGTGEMSFFAVRYIRGMNTNHAPGILILKLNENILQEVRENIVNDQLMYFILDVNEEICFSQLPDGMKWDSSNAEYEALFWERVNSRVEAETQDLSKGILCWEYDENSQFTILTYAPADVANQVVKKLQRMIILVFLITYIIAVSVTVLYVGKLIRPIRSISDTMGSFDESHLDDRIDINTNTELDEIGNAYNRMVVRVKTLMDDVRMKERDLRKSELDSLMYQIRPHFLYNTLDTIYMLARIQKEETIMKMIQSLSKFLRINLSDGSEQIEVRKELEHVSSYLDIQKIRNADLFSHETEMSPEVEKLPVMKMILQPVAENCIKYGFKDIEEDGMIRIRAFKQDNMLVFTVENNGTPVTEEALTELNSFERVTMDEIDQVIQRKQGGFGIRNVVKRLRMRYGDGISFRYTALEQGTVCTIQIPLPEESCEAENAEGMTALDDPETNEKKGERK